MSSQPNAATASDPSMEDILASIRRILSEDEAPAHPPPSAPAHPPTEVLTLDASMIVDSAVANDEDEIPGTHVPPPEPFDHEDPDATVPPMARVSAPPPKPAPDVKPETAAPRPMEVARMADESLVAPEAAAAAANSVHSLIRKLAEERAAPVYRNGPTLEDLVREEMRPLLKAWLDSHVPAIVERLVRAEIERVVNRAVP